MLEEGRPGLDGDVGDENGEEQRGKAERPAP
jgi:hypothetical protein